MTYKITTIADNGQLYYYRKKGIRWVTKIEAADNFKSTELDAIVNDLLESVPDQKLRIIPN